MPEFGLYPFQNPSGGDFRKLSLADLPAVTAKP
jgi:miniconductance mechanosensitive channel